MNTTESIIEITIPGKPKAQPRPRFRRCGSFVNTYDTAKADKEVVQQIVKLKYKPSIIKPPIKMKLVAYMPIPKSLSNKKKEELLGEYHTKRPDLDNIVKFYKDALEGICYKDDSHISHEVSKKVYDKNPRVEITFLSLCKDL